MAERANNGDRTMRTLGENDNGKQVAVRTGERFELRLPENATTGYRWSPDGFDAKVLRLEDSTGDYPGGASGVVGAGGTAVFRFAVLAPGSTELKLKYWRSFEGEGSAIQRFRIRVDAAR
jgi:inhibitor of cysteine peptidase